MSDHAGELAALATAGCWMISALSFEAAGKRIGTLSLNFIRLVIGMALLTVFAGLAREGWFPTDTSSVAWAWLAASALTGLVFGDLCLFRAFVELGPRLSSLIMSSVPAITAVLGYLMLGEVLGWRDLAGIGLVVGGIGLAVGFRPREDEALRPKGSVSRGILLAFGGALGQASGLVLSKIGLGDGDPFGATQIRLLVALVAFALICTATRWWPRVREGVRNGKAMQYTAIGATFGPFLGVSLSLIAVQLAPAGIAASLMATTPILLLPAVAYRGERVGVAGIVGALVAVGGVYVLVT